jgi:hypothetical protein
MRTAVGRACLVFVSIHVLMIVGIFAAVRLRSVMGRVPAAVAAA